MVLKQFNAVYCCLWTYIRVLSLQNSFSSFLKIYKYNEDIVSIVDCLVLLVSDPRFQETFKPQIQQCEEHTLNKCKYSPVIYCSGGSIVLKMIQIEIKCTEYSYILNINLLLLFWPILRMRSRDVAELCNLS